MNKTPDYESGNLGLNPKGATIFRKLYRKLEALDRNNVPHFDEFPCGVCELLDEAHKFLASFKRKGR